jgi:geranylgeranyl diphosphate synthase type I
MALGFQIQDDIIDILDDKGHEKGSDIRKGKKTLLAIKALELSDTENKKILARFIGKADATESEMNKVIRIMQDSGAIEYSKRLANSKNIHSKELVKKINIPGHYKEIFFELADFMIQRKF